MAAHDAPNGLVDWSSTVQHDLDESLTESFRYLMDVPGKDVRGMLIDAFQFWLCVSDEKVKAIKHIIASLHGASLLVDDVEDGSKVRRGVPAAHLIYGVPTVINTANYIYFVALWELQKLQSPAAMNVFIQEMLNLHRGQGQDILWRENCVCPTEEAYCQMISDKTGGLFRLALGILQSFSDPAVSKYSATDFNALIEALSLYFQVRDDFVNCVDKGDYAESKGTFFEDLSEGKFSYPIIHSIKNAKPGDTRLLSLLKQKPTELHLKTFAVTVMQQTDSLNYTREKLRRLHKDAADLIEGMGGNVLLMGILTKLDSKLDQLLTDSGDALSSAQGSGGYPQKRSEGRGKDMVDDCSP